jgi:hypothetical protein
MFHFLFVFKLFLIGYAPTLSKRKDIVLKQKAVKGFELVLHREKEIFFEKGLLVYKVSGNPFPNGGIQGAYNFSK